MAPASTTPVHTGLSRPSQCPPPTRPLGHPRSQAIVSLFCASKNLAHGLEDDDVTNMLNWSALAPRQAEVVSLLRDESPLMAKEIAARLDTSEDAVRVIISDIRKRFHRDVIESIRGQGDRVNPSLNGLLPPR